MSRSRKKSKKKARPKRTTPPEAPEPQSLPPQELDLDSLEPYPVTYQDLVALFNNIQAPQLFPLRAKTYSLIEEMTGACLICYTMNTHARDVEISRRASISDEDVVGIRDLLTSTKSTDLDLFIISNGGSITSAERIIKLIRESVSGAFRVLVSGEAYSAATLMCFAADEIIMTPGATLGPIDPQFRGIPAREFLETFSELLERVKESGEQAIAPFIPLFEKYQNGIELVGLTKNAINLAQTLAREWLSKYNVKGTSEPKIEEIVNRFHEATQTLTHERSIDRNDAVDVGLNVKFSEKCKNGDMLTNYLVSLSNQFHMWFDKTIFYKAYEDARGTGWGRKYQPPQLIVPQPHAQR